MIGGAGCGTLCLHMFHTAKHALVLLPAGTITAGGAKLPVRTRAGHLLRAVAQEAELTALWGADPARAQLFAFTVAGALAGRRYRRYRACG